MRCRGWAANPPTRGGRAASTEGTIQNLGQVARVWHLSVAYSKHQEHGLAEAPLIRPCDPCVVAFAKLKRCELAMDLETVAAAIVRAVAGQRL
jgi:hypothetical protein